MKKMSQFIFVPIIILGTSCLISCEKGSGLPVIGEGNEYDTVVIGTQTWPKQNLKTTKYYNGVSIPLVTDNTEWISMSSAAYCWYDNDSKYKEDHGALYNWYVVNTGTLCPIGYHVPTKDEWTTLINYLGSYVAAPKLKDNTPGFWKDTGCATNETGFSARPSGGRGSSDGEFYTIGEEGDCWTSSLSGTG